jgi:hypothetical protein
MTTFTKRGPLWGAQKSTNRMSFCALTKSGWIGALSMPIDRRLVGGLNVAPRPLARQPSRVSFERPPAAFQCGFRRSRESYGARRAFRALSACWVRILMSFSCNFRRMCTYTNRALNSFRMRTYDLLDLKSPGMNTYRKMGWGGLALVPLLELSEAHARNYRCPGALSSHLREFRHAF